MPSCYLLLFFFFFEESSAKKKQNSAVSQILHQYENSTWKLRWCRIAWKQATSSFVENNGYHCNMQCQTVVIPEDLTQICRWRKMDESPGGSALSKTPELVFLESKPRGEEAGTDQTAICALFVCTLQSTLNLLKQRGVVRVAIWAFVRAIKDYSASSRCHKGGGSLFPALSAYYRHNWTIAQLKNEAKEYQSRQTDASTTQVVNMDSVTSTLDSAEFSLCNFLEKKKWSMTAVLDWCTHTHTLTLTHTHTHWIWFTDRLQLSGGQNTQTCTNKTDGWNIHWKVSDLKQVATGTRVSRVTGELDKDWKCEIKRHLFFT